MSVEHSIDVECRFVISSSVNNEMGHTLITGLQTGSPARVNIESQLLQATCHPVALDSELRISLVACADSSCFHSKSAKTSRVNDGVRAGDYRELSRSARDGLRPEVAVVKDSFRVTLSPSQN